jgi:hypothetical protein
MEDASFPPLLKWQLKLCKKQQVTFKLADDYFVEPAL